MTFQAIVHQERTEITRSIHFAVSYGMIETWRRCSTNGKNPQEPDVVAGLVKDSTPMICHALNSILGQYGLGVSVFSVFCHQTPKVRFAKIDKSSCELGDILFIHTHTDKSRHVVRNSLLYQAKMSSKQPYKIANSESDQLKLYSEWPDFRYFRSGSLSGKTRRVSPKSPHLGAQYLLIDDRPPKEPHSGLLGLSGTYPIGSCMPGEILLDHNDFATEFCNFLLLRSGRTFVDKDQCGRKSNWSRLVWELIEVGFTKGFTRKFSGRISEGRGSGESLEELDGLVFAMSSSNSTMSTATDILGHRRATELYTDYADNPPDRQMLNFEVGESPRNGVSLVLIETSEIDEE